MPGKIPSLLMEGIPAYLMQKKLWVAVKIFLLLQRESSVVCKAISRKSAEKFTFFYSVTATAQSDLEFFQRFTAQSIKALKIFKKCSKIHGTAHAP
jgi:hypothetical protein